MGSGTLPPVECLNTGHDAKSYAVLTLMFAHAMSTSTRSPALTLRKPTVCSAATVPALQCIRKTFHNVRHYLRWTPTNGGFIPVRRSSNYSTYRKSTPTENLDDITLQTRYVLCIGSFGLCPERSIFIRPSKSSNKANKMNRSMWNSFRKGNNHPTDGQLDSFTSHQSEDPVNNLTNGETVLKQSLQHRRVA